MVERRDIAAAALGAGAIGAALWAFVIEPRRLRVRELDLDLDGWPRVRVAVVADLHAGAPHVDERRVEEIVAAVNRTKPDLVALLGDYVDPQLPLGHAIAPEAVAARLGALQAPLGTFAVLGNNDWENGGERVRRALLAAGIEVLENDAASVEFAGEVIWIVGLADAGTRRPDIETPFALVPASAPLIVLTHNPDVFPKLPRRPALVLSGHTHGAQVNVPVVRGRVTPSRYGDRYTGGVFRRDGRVMYSSTGIGTSTLPVRFRAPPEIAVVELSGSVR